MATWRLYNNIQASLYDFITAQAISDSLTDIAGNSITFQIGRKNSEMGDLPIITFYVESEVISTPFIGSFVRDDKQIVIIDIYALTETDRLDLAKWVVDTLNNGWPYYSYADNPADADSPIKTKSGRINVYDRIENTRVNLNQNVDKYDQHRHRISLMVYKSGS